LDLGVILAEPGYHTRAFVEWEDWPRAVLVAAQRAGYFAPAPIWDDLRSFDARPFRRAFNIVLAGYPCQPFSAAGKRGGAADPRHLWPEVARIVRECAPEWVFLENVAGHVTLGLETVLRELWRMGYTPAAGLFSAAEVGAPHQRLRIFILAHTDEPAPGTANYNPAGNSDFTRKAEALALGITNWSTPKGSDGAKGGPGQSYGSGGVPPLPAQAAQWQTPVADDQADRLRGKINSRGEPKLSAQAIQWPTPAAQTWKGSSPTSVTRADGKSRMDILHYRAEQGFTHPDLAITPHGLQPSHHAPISRPLWAYLIASHGRVVSRRILKARARRRLNPLFVGWLMGWPIGHALCACSVTEFTHWQQRMRGALSRLPMASGPWIWRPEDGPEGPAQMNLFEGMLP
jgi:site-specific DNA-cytosine methylase